MPRLGSWVRIPSPAPESHQTAEFRKKPSGQRSCTPAFYTSLLHNRPIGLVLVGRIYHYRRRVPVDVADVLGRREICRSLDTDSYSVAVRRLHLTATTVEAAFEQGRHSLGQTIDPKLLATRDGPSPNGLEPVSLSTSTVIVSDAAARAASRVTASSGARTVSLTEISSSGVAGSNCKQRRPGKRAPTKL